MVSICTCATNNKPDLEMFIRALHRHNESSTFEVCVTHDTRIEDGTTEMLQQLQKEFNNIKVIEWTKQDAVQHLERLLNIYEKESLLRKELIDGMRSNLELYQKDCLFLPGTSLLWLSSGVLYNKAASIATGKYMVITPSDFLYTFNLKDLEIHMEYNQVNGRFYSSPNAIWARVSNHDTNWLLQHTDEINRGIGHREGYRYDSIEVFRDYLRASSNLQDYVIPDFKNNTLLEINDPFFTTKVSSIIDQCFGKLPNGEGMQSIQGFHGFHAMTRRSFDEIGGFEEIWFGRAYADDKMSHLGGKEPGPYNLDPEFSVVWCGQHELAYDRGPKYPPNWKDTLHAIDPYWDQHPIPPNTPTYLYDGYASSTISEVINRSFNKNAKPRRVST